MSDFKHNSEQNYIEIIHRLVTCIVIMILLIIALIVINIMDLQSPKKNLPEKKEIIKPTPVEVKTIADVWTAPDFEEINKEKNAAEITYGKDLIANTAFYFGPNGKLQHSGNGMNCQNCHLKAGTVPFGNNYSAVASTYPKFRERSGSTESVEKRVNDCFERSLNGKALDTNGKEMRAIVAYIKWLGKDVPKGQKPKGAGLTELAFIDRAADPAKGQTVYSEKCKSCHSAGGEGKLNADGISYQYPPLWGMHSYNTGAGLFRLSRFAGYVKSNMPQNTTYDAPQLSNEEAWDVAAFVNSQARPEKDLSKDWPKTAGKPIDHPFGPYADKFTEAQHKFGPFGPIAAAKRP
ncbi:MAG: c-type cytochrome [Bacteroidota bacterium]